MSAAASGKMDSVQFIGFGDKIKLFVTHSGCQSFELIGTYDCVGKKAPGHPQKESH